jgi:hypothetical protein
MGWKYDGLMGWKITDGNQRKFCKKVRFPDVRLIEEQNEDLVETVWEERFYAQHCLSAKHCSRIKQMGQD